LTEEGFHGSEVDLVFVLLQMLKPFHRHYLPKKKMKRKMNHHLNHLDVQILSAFIEKRKKTPDEIKSKHTN